MRAGETPALPSETSSSFPSCTWERPCPGNCVASLYWLIGATLRKRTFTTKTMKTINELDVVALTCDLPESGLKTGDVGTVVLVHGEGVAFEVEFLGYDGHTVALTTLESTQVRHRPPFRQFSEDQVNGWIAEDEADIKPSSL